MKNLIQVAVGALAGAGLVIGATETNSPWIIGLLAGATFIVAVVSLAALATLAPTDPGWIQSAHAWLNRQPYGPAGFSYGSAVTGLIYLAYAAAKAS